MGFNGVEGTVVVHESFGDPDSGIAVGGAYFEDVFVFAVFD